MCSAIFFGVATADAATARVRAQRAWNTEQVQEGKAHRALLDPSMYALGCRFRANAMENVAVKAVGELGSGRGVTRAAQRRLGAARGREGKESEEEEMEMEWLIKWRGLPFAEASWELAGSFAGGAEARELMRSACGALRCVGAHTRAPSALRVPLRVLVLRSTSSSSSD